MNRKGTRCEDDAHLRRERAAPGRTGTRTTNEACYISWCKEGASSARAEPRNYARQGGRNWAEGRKAWLSRCCPSVFHTTKTLAVGCASPHFGPEPWPCFRMSGKEYVPREEGNQGSKTPTFRASYIYATDGVYAGMEIAGCVAIIYSRFGLLRCPSKTLKDGRRILPRIQDRLGRWEGCIGESRGGPRALIGNVWGGRLMILIGIDGLSSLEWLEVVRGPGDRGHEGSISLPGCAARGARCQIALAFIVRGPGRAVGSICRIWFQCGFSHASCMRLWSSSDPRCLGVTETFHPDFKVGVCGGSLASGRLALSRVCHVSCTLADPRGRGPSSKARDPQPMRA